MDKRSVTEIIGDARGAERQGTGHKIRHHLRRDIKRLIAKIPAEPDAQRRVRLIAALQKSRTKLAQQEVHHATAQADGRYQSKTFVDPRARR